MKICTGPCGESKPLTSFRIRRTISGEVTAKEYRSSFCKKCESEARDDKKWDKKAENAIRNEAKKRHFTVGQLHEWGITTEYIKSLFLDIWAGVVRSGGDKDGVYSCPNCRAVNHICNKRNPDGSIVPLKPGDFSLDVKDKERVRRTGKLTYSNIWVLCQTANLAKGSKDPTDYDIEVLETYRDTEAIKRGVQDILPEYQPIIPKNKNQLVFQLS